MKVRPALGKFGMAVRRKSALLKGRRLILIDNLNLAREGDTIKLMKALKAIDASEGQLTGSELKTAGRLIKRICRKAALRETEHMCRVVRHLSVLLVEHLSAF